MAKRTPEQRFWAKVRKARHCWIWQGARNRDGYGTCSFNGVRGLAHRQAYELLIGPIPDGLTLDHLCRNPACVNPRHLEPVSLGENTHRAWAAWHASQEGIDLRLPTSKETAADRPAPAGITTADLYGGPFVQTGWRREGRL